MDDDGQNFLEEIELTCRMERARDLLLELVQLWWEASEEVTVGLAA